MNQFTKGADYNVKIPKSEIIWLLLVKLLRNKFRIQSVITINILIFMVILLFMFVCVLCVDDGGGQRRELGPCPQGAFTGSCELRIDHIHGLKEVVNISN